MSKQGAERSDVNSPDSSQDDLLAVALAAGLLIRDAALAAGVSESTAHRRKRDPAFNARVQELRAGSVEAALGRLTTHATGAVDVLAALLKDPDPRVRLAAG